MKKFIYIFFSFIFSASLMAQTGPGGVGNSSNNEFWLDADRISIPSGSKLENWPDRSGNGNDAGIPDPHRQPVYNSNQINGHDAVYFDGNSDGIYFNSNITSQSGSFFFIVNKPNTNTNKKYIFSGGYHGVNSRYTSGRDFWGTSYQNDKISNHSLSSSYDLLSSITSNSTATVDMYTNGGNLSSQSISGYPSQLAYSFIGCYRTSSGGLKGFAEINLAEAIHFNEALNVTEKTLVENYLASKYALSISNDKFAYDGSYPNRVVGVGQENGASGDNHLESTSSIVTTSFPSNLNDGEYLLFGDDGASLGLNNSNIPPSFSASAEILNRQWRVNETGGDLGNGNYIFDLSNLNFSVPNTVQLIVDSDADFTNGVDTIISGSFQSSDSTMTFPNINLSDGVVFSIGSDSKIETISDGNWNSSSTWNCGCVPSPDRNVSVYHDVTVASDASINVVDIIVDLNKNPFGNASIILSNGARLSVTGDITFGASTFLNGSGGALSFEGSSNQNFTNNSGNMFTLDSMVVQSGGTVTATGSGVGVEILTALDINSGDLDNQVDTFAFRSTSTQTAIITPIPSGSQMTGNFVMERFMAGQAAEWHDLASPIDGSNIADWDEELYMSGVGGNDGNACCPIFYSVYRYDGTNQKYKEITSTSHILQTGIGYEVWLADNSTTWNAKAWNTIGIPNQGDHTENLYFKSSTNEGWNLLGNPYQAHLDWDKVARANQAGAVWTLENGSYTAHNYGDGFLIPPGQGFWVDISASNYIVFEERAKSTSTSNTFYKKGSPYFTMEVNSPMFRWANKTKIEIRNDADETYGDWDARFRPTKNLEAPSITTLSSDSPEELSINSFDFQYENMTIPVKVNVNEDGKYNIDFNGTENLTNHYSCVYIEDMEKDEMIDVTLNSSYEFEMDSSYTGTRFKLHLMNPKGKSCDDILASDGNTDTYKDLSDFNFFVRDSEYGTEIEFRDFDGGTADIEVLNLMGQKVFEMKDADINGNTLQIPELDLHGMHMVVVRTPGKQKAKKVYMK